MPLVELTHDEIDTACDALRSRATHLRALAADEASMVSDLTRLRWREAARGYGRLAKKLDLARPDAPASEEAGARAPLGDDVEQALRDVRC